MVLVHYVFHSTGQTLLSRFSIKQLGFCLSNVFIGKKFTENGCLAGEASNHNTIKYINLVIIISREKSDVRMLTIPHDTSFATSTSSSIFAACSHAPEIFTFYFIYIFLIPVCFHIHQNSLFYAGNLCV